MFYVYRFETFETFETLPEQLHVYLRPASIARAGYWRVVTAQPIPQFANRLCDWGDDRPVSRDALRDVLGGPNRSSVHDRLFALRYDPADGVVVYHYDAVREAVEAVERPQLLIVGKIVPLSDRRDIVVPADPTEEEARAIFYDSPPGDVEAVYVPGLDIWEGPHPSQVAELIDMYYMSISKGGLTAHEVFNYIS